MIDAAAQHPVPPTAPAAEGPMFAARCSLFAEAQLPPLSKPDQALLEPLLQSNLDFRALAAATAIPLPRLYAWAATPHIAAYINFHLNAKADHDAATARAELRALLANPQSAIRNPQSSRERRRALELLLRLN